MKLIRCSFCNVLTTADKIHLASTRKAHRPYVAICVDCVIAAFEKQEASKLPLEDANQMPLIPEGEGASA
jgi:hypothetical protein